MSKIVSLFSVNSLGFTFLSWSLHYLSGHRKYYLCDQNKFLPLPENPLTDLNAHGFLKNHPVGAKQTEECISKLNSLNDCNFSTVYAFAGLGEDLTEIDYSNIVETQKRVVANQQKDSKKLTNLCAKSGPLIISEIDSHNRTYQFNVRDLDKRIYEPGSYSSLNERWGHFNSLFYSDSIKSYKEHGLTNPWDTREMTALNLRIYPSESIGDYVDLTMDHYYLNSNDLWFNLDSEIFNIFDYIKEQVDQSRIDTWNSIYHDWSAKQRNLNKFEWYLDHIIDCILKNHYFDLSRLNLTSLQEAIIQHILIYHHNLTIKGWGLSKFPPNTQDLHALLESNFHKLTPY